MSDAPRTARSERDWVTLLGGVRVSRQWMARHTPQLLAAWLDAATAARRRSIAAEIVRTAAELESEPVVGDGEPGSSAWAAVAERIDRRLLLGSDWWPLSAALTRAAAAGYDVSARLPALGAAAPLPDRHPARELHWRLLADCPAALPGPDADGRPGHIAGRTTGSAQPVRGSTDPSPHLSFRPRRPQPRLSPSSEGDPP